MKSSEGLVLNTGLILLINLPVKNTTGQRIRGDGPLKLRPK